MRPNSAPHLALTDARHVLDRLPPWRCTWPPRAPPCRRVRLPPCCTHAPYLSEHRIPERPPSLPLPSPRSAPRRDARPPWPSSELAGVAAVFPSQPPSLLTSNAISFASLACTPCSCSPSKTTLGAPQSPAAVASDRRCAWLVHLGPPLGHPRPPAGARGTPSAPPPLHRRRRASSGRHREPPTASSALNPVKGFAQEFEEREGLICNVIDSCE
ncbi:proline-rich receptor-like protein kinase PERK2 [Miscanthus floridulus]|uniref:proline-rich receptor-like protein kinase PERK2 n=1 Tax=Miscanthus floridulus TaxID=154761 RepID=UPI00345773D6